MQEGMTSPADIDTAPRHIDLFEVLAEPLVAVTGFRYQMMESNKMFAPAKRTDLFHNLRSQLAPYLAVQWRRIS